jgi:transposase
MAKKYIVRLNAEEKSLLEDMVNSGVTAAYKIKHANILLKANADGPDWSDRRIAEAFNCHCNTVAKVRQRFVERGLDLALKRRPQNHPSRERALDGKGEAILIATSCGELPPGAARWTLKMLADKLVELDVVQSITPETVRRTLKKTL